MQQCTGLPVEVVGNLANKGREWQPEKKPVRVDVHDFPDPEVGKAIPYGVYDVGANEGFVSVGDDADTAAFAVATIAAGGTRWAPWPTRERPDSSSPPMPGGPTAPQSAVKRELGRLAADTGLGISVCHLPPGTSKWNKTSTGCSRPSRRTGVDGR